MQRFTHTIVSAWAVAAFLMVGVGAWYLLKNRHYDIARRSIRLGLVVALIASIGMFLTGDWSSRQVAQHQPVKFAAMQGLFETTQGAPMIIFALPPSQDGEANAPSIVVTSLLSWLTHGDTNATVQGLNYFPQELWPPVGHVLPRATTTWSCWARIMLLAMLLGMLAWRARPARDAGAAGCGSRSSSRPHR